ncbi:bactofilin family protein [Gynurincola endophyticus]|jgi:cytoskeletal protein CcmA (bactofilin family)|uniref:bactofilin family protein n=1 Tax=Gynurincola endophyticus TaxID=2479004 RepID=UPI000F8DBB28|nr:polymer-forming cytoskeletal protein [Gynurincola endophyticus]
MFNGKSKSITFNETPSHGQASIIAAGTTLKGDLTAGGDIRIDGRLEGNIYCSAKVVIGANGSVTGDIEGQQADIMGSVTGTIKVKEILQLKGGSLVNGNIHAAKLQIEPDANFNGQCHMLVEKKTSLATNGIETAKAS